MAENSLLDKLAVFNLMVLPGVINETVLSITLTFCEKKVAFLIMDPQQSATADAYGNQPLIFDLSLRCG